MELDFKPGKFALNRNTLETVVVKDVKDDQIEVISMLGIEGRWVDKKDYNLFKRKNGKWNVEGPPINLSDNFIQHLDNQKNNTNISERFK